jgi:hypothetical protein
MVTVWIALGPARGCRESARERPVLPSCPVLSPGFDRRGSTSSSSQVPGWRRGFPTRRTQHGAEIGTREAAFAADIVVQGRTCGASPLTDQELDRLRPDQVIVGISDALGSPREIDRVASRIGEVVDELSKLPCKAVAAAVSGI